MISLHFRKIGEGQPILLLHGLFGMSDNLTGIAKLLAQNGYSVYMIDLRNHGHSAHTSDHNYAVMAEDIVDFIADHSIDHPIVIGHSMGGKVAIQLLNKYPKLIGEVVVIDIAPYAYPVHHAELIQTLLSIDLKQIEKRSEVEKILRDEMDEEGTIQFLLKNLYWESTDNLAWRFNLFTLDNHIEEIGAATWPTEVISNKILFVKGSHSGYIDESRWTEITQWYPNSSLVKIENAGHWVHADQPNLLIEEIVNYLK